MAERRGDWIQTVSGKQFWPLDPRPEDVSIEDIAHALSMICRFVGHCLEFYSVAQHSVYVSDIAPNREEAMWFLLHDAAEAYIGDISRPLKKNLWAFGDGFKYHVKTVESDILKCIGEAFGLTPLSSEGEERLKIADNVMLATEARDLMLKGPSWRSLEGVETVSDIIVPESWSRAKYMFLTRFEELKGSQQ